MAEDEIEEMEQDLEQNDIPQEEYGLNQAVQDINAGRIATPNAPQMNSRQNNLKATKKRVQQKQQQNPFQKHKIHKPIAEDRASTNPLVKFNLDRFNQQSKKKAELNTQVQKAQTPNKAEDLEQKYEKEEKKQKVQSYALMTSIMAEDLRRATSGPVGWFQNLKGCFKMTVICLTVIGGGALATILCLV